MFCIVFYPALCKSTPAPLAADTAESFINIADPRLSTSTSVKGDKCFAKCEYQNQILRVSREATQSFVFLIRCHKCPYMLPTREPESGSDTAYLAHEQ